MKLIVLEIFPDLVNRIICSFNSYNIISEEGWKGVPGSGALDQRGRHQDARRRQGRHLTSGLKGSKIDRLIDW